MKLDDGITDAKFRAGIRENFRHCPMCGTIRDMRRDAARAMMPEGVAFAETELAKHQAGGTCIDVRDD